MFGFSSTLFTAKFREIRLDYYYVKKQFKANSSKTVCLKSVLFTKTESCDNRTVSLNINLLEICEKITSVTDHFKKTSS